MADEVDVVQSVEKRSEDVEQSMAESDAFTAGSQFMLPVRCGLSPPVLLTPRRPTTAADSPMQPTVPTLSDAATHSDGN